jgi:hypothetical protein
MTGRSGSIEKGAAAVFDWLHLVAAAPLFCVDFRLDTPLQGPLRKLTDGLYPWCRRLMEVPLVGLGSRHVERRHLGFAPGPHVADRQAALLALLRRLESHAHGEGASLVSIKGLAFADDAASRRTGSTRV